MTTRQRKLNNNLEVRRADELSIENERVRPPQRTAAVIAQQRREEERREKERRERERIAVIDARREQEEKRRRTDPVTPYITETSTQGLFEPNYSDGQTSEQRLEQIIQILWTRVSELERDVEFLRER